MSRTKRQIPHESWMRRPRHIRQYRILEQAIDEITAEGFHARPRDKQRKTPNAWDDLLIAARMEIRETP